MPPSKSDTRLAQARREHGIGQEELARAAGLGRSTIQRIEARTMTNPPIRYLANCAIVLGIPLEDLIEPEWRAWTDFGGLGA